MSWLSFARQKISENSQKERFAIPPSLKKDQQDWFEAYAVDPSRGREIYINLFETQLKPESKATYSLFTGPDSKYHSFDLCYFDKININRHLAALDHVDLIRFEVINYTRTGLQIAIARMREQGLRVEGFPWLDLDSPSNRFSSGFLLIGKLDAKEWEFK